MSLALQALDMGIPIIFNDDLYKKVLGRYSIGVEFQEDPQQITWRPLTHNELEHMIRTMEVHIWTDMRNHQTFSMLIRLTQFRGAVPKNLEYVNRFIHKRCSESVAQAI